MKVRYTVPSDASRVGYSTNGSTTVFSVPFVFFDDTDLQVILVNNTTAVETTLVLTTDYTVTGGAGSTGSLTTLSAYASGSTLVIQREVPYTQEIDYEPNDGFPADVNEEGLDRATMQIQQVRRRARQTPKLPATYDPESGDISLPMPSAGQVLVGNDDEDGWINVDVFEGGVDFPVLVSTAQDYDLLEYDSAGSVWRNKTLATILGRLLTTQGDLLRRGASGVERLAIGAANRVLRSNGTTESWAQVNLTTDVTGVLPSANGGFVAPRGYYAADSTGWTLSSSFSDPFVISEGTQVFSHSYTAVSGQTVVVEVDVSGVYSQNATASAAIFYDGGTNCVAQSDMQFANTAAHKGPNRVVYGYVSDGSAHTISARIAGNVTVDRVVLVIREFLV